MNLISKGSNFLLFIFFATIIIIGCKKEEPFDPFYPPHTATPYDLNIPKDFPDMPIPDFNPMTVEGVKLGRMLYYDNILSTNGNSCSSCHHQVNAFSSSGPGPSGNDIPPHINMGWNPDFGWTGGEDVLDHVALADLEEGNIFLDANNDSIRVRFERHDEYKLLFWEAFGVKITEVNLENRKHFISYSLAQFIRTQISANSKFDKFKRNESGGNLTQSEFNGYTIFFTEKGDCFHCHGYPLFTSNTFHNIGLDSLFTGNDLGRYTISLDPIDIGKFSAPTLRNIELTSPYMHDCRFTTLEEVVEHYNSGVIHTATIDPIMTKQGKEFGLNLSTNEKADLVAFLKTLTDDSFTQDQSLSNPH